MKRSTRAELARETLAILKRGRYVTPDGAAVSIRREQTAAERDSVLYTPETLGELWPEVPGETAAPTRFEVTNETTLSAARRLIEEHNAREVCCLNFASAKHPGGGFLSGAEAQEESLARSSGLYPCIRQMDGYYRSNHACGTALYTDHMIYSPNVHVIRDDTGRLLDKPLLVSFITAPAVNAGVVKEREPSNIRQILPTMGRRAEYVLKVAVANRHKHLVLGAWGCGVFQNDPADVAEIFRRFLGAEGAFNRAFNAVTFAVLDKTADRRVITPFEGRFARHC